MKEYLPSSFILRYVRAEMNVHAWMNLIKRTIDIQEKKLWKIYVQSQWRVVFLWYHIFWHCSLPERVTYTTLHNHFSEMDYPILQTLYHIPASCLGNLPPLTYAPEYDFQKCMWVTYFNYQLLSFVFFHNAALCSTSKDISFVKSKY